MRRALRPRRARLHRRRRLRGRRRRDAARFRVRRARCRARCIAQHAEDPALVRGGHMHEGAWSARLGIPGRPAEAESSIVARDLELARLTGGRYHVLHLSSRGVGRARARREGRRRARHRRVHAAASRAHRRSVRGVRPRVQDEPAVARASDVDALPRRAARRHDRRDRHRPRAARARHRRTFRSRTRRRDARGRDRARGRAHDAGRARAC